MGKRTISASSRNIQRIRFSCHIPLLKWKTQLSSLQKIFRRLDRQLSEAFLGCVLFYQRFISVSTMPHCRFYPTCSAYAKCCLDEHGFMKGVGLFVLRFCKCHPWHPGGVDLPPQKEPSKIKDKQNKGERYWNEC